MIRRAAVYCMLVFSAVSPAAGSTAELETAIFRAIVFGPQGYTVDQRRNLAGALVAYWSNFRERIPRLTPREQDWAKGEAEAADLVRLNRLMGTREGGLYMTYDQVSRCHSSATDVAAAVGKSVRMEVLSWLALLRCYRFAEDLPVYLNRAGLIAEPRSDLEFKMSGSGMLQTALIGVTESLVLEIP